jgi:hypothetical protein
MFTSACVLNLVTPGGGWSSDVYKHRETVSNIDALQYIGKCNDWHLFVQLNKCKLYSSECLFKNIKALDTNAPEYISSKFPRVDVMSLLTTASNLPCVFASSLLLHRNISYAGERGGGGVGLFFLVKEERRRTAQRQEIGEL